MTDAIIINYQVRYTINPQTDRLLRVEWFMTDDQGMPTVLDRNDGPAVIVFDPVTHEAVLEEYYEKGELWATRDLKPDPNTQASPPML